jgi:hypothetical protein
MNSEKPHSSANLYATNPRRNNPDANQVLRVDRPANNCLCHSTADSLVGELFIECKRILKLGRFRTE